MSELRIPIAHARPHSYWMEVSRFDPCDAYHAMRRCCCSLARLTTGPDGARTRAVGRVARCAVWCMYRARRQPRETVHGWY